MSDPFTPEQLAQLRQVIQEAIERTIVHLARQIDPMSGVIITKGGLVQPNHTPEDAAMTDFDGIVLRKDGIYTLTDDPAALDSIADLVMRRLQAQLGVRR